MLYSGSGALTRQSFLSWQGTDEGALDFALNRALDAWYNDRAWFHSLAKRCMLQVSIPLVP